MTRGCGGRAPDGGPCGAAPLRGSSLCFFHDPEHAQDAAQARHLGGIRRRREATVATAYDLEGLDLVLGLRRLLDIVVADALALDNGVSRLRVLLHAVNTAIRLRESEGYEARLAALEAVIFPRPSRPDRADDVGDGPLRSRDP